MNTYTPGQAVEIMTAPNSWETAMYVRKAVAERHHIVTFRTPLESEVHQDKIRPVGRLSEDDLTELHQITTRLYNLARRNGYPSDLKSLYGEAQATLAAYAPEGWTRVDTSTEDMH